MSSIQNVTPYDDQSLGNAGLKTPNMTLAETATIMQSITVQRKIILAEIRQ